MEWAGYDKFDLNFKITPWMDNQTWGRISQLNRSAYDIYSSNPYNSNRVINFYGEEAKKLKPKNISYKEQYRYLATTDERKAILDDRPDWFAGLFYNRPNSLWKFRSLYTPIAQLNRRKLLKFAIKHLPPDNDIRVNFFTILRTRAAETTIKYFKEKYPCFNEYFTMKLESYDWSTASTDVSSESSEYSSFSEGE